MTTSALQRVWPVKEDGAIEPLTASAASVISEATAGDVATLMLSTTNAKGAIAIASAAARGFDEGLGRPPFGVPSPEATSFLAALQVMAAALVQAFPDAITPASLGEDLSTTFPIVATAFIQGSDVALLPATHALGGSGDKAAALAHIPSVKVFVRVLNSLRPGLQFPLKGFVQSAMQFMGHDAPYVEMAAREGLVTASVVRQFLGLPEPVPVEAAPAEPVAKKKSKKKVDKAGEGSSAKAAPLLASPSEVLAVLCRASLDDESKKVIIDALKPNATFRHAVGSSTDCAAAVMTAFGTELVKTVHPQSLIPSCSATTAPFLMHRLSKYPSGCQAFAESPMGEADVKEVFALCVKHLESKVDVPGAVMLLSATLAHHQAIPCCDDPAVSIPRAAAALLSRVRPNEGCLEEASLRPTVLGTASIALRQLLRRYPRTVDEEDGETVSAAERFASAADKWWPAMATLALPPIATGSSGGGGSKAKGKKGGGDKSSASKPAVVADPLSPSELNAVCLAAARVLKLRQIMGNAVPQLATSFDKHVLSPPVAAGGLLDATLLPDTNRAVGAMTREATVTLAMACADASSDTPSLWFLETVANNNKYCAAGFKKKDGSWAATRLSYVRALLSQAHPTVTATIASAIAENPDASVSESIVVGILASLKMDGTAGGGDDEASAAKRLADALGILLRAPDAAFPLVVEEHVTVLEAIDAAIASKKVLVSNHTKEEDLLALQAKIKASIESSREAATDAERKAAELEVERIKEEVAKKTALVAALAAERRDAAAAKKVRATKAAAVRREAERRAAERRAKAREAEKEQAVINAHEQATARRAERVARLQELARAKAVRDRAQEDSRRARTLRSHLLELDVEASNVDGILVKLRRLNRNVSFDELHEFLVTQSSTVPTDLSVHIDGVGGSAAPTKEEKATDESRVWLMDDENFWDACQREDEESQEKKAAEAEAAAAESAVKAKDRWSFHRRIRPLLDAFDYTNVASGFPEGLPIPALRALIPDEAAKKLGFDDTKDLVREAALKKLVRAARGFVTLTPLGYHYHCPFADNDASFATYRKQRARFLAEAMRLRIAAAAEEAAAAPHPPVQYLVLHPTVFEDASVYGLDELAEVYPYVRYVVPFDITERVDDSVKAEGAGAKKHRDPYRGILASEADSSAAAVASLDEEVMEWLVAKRRSMQANVIWVEHEHGAGLLQVTKLVDDEAQWRMLTPTVQSAVMAVAEKCPDQSLDEATGYFVVCTSDIGVAAEAAEIGFTVHTFMPGVCDCGWEWCQDADGEDDDDSLEMEPVVLTDELY